LVGLGAFTRDLLRMKSTADPSAAVGMTKQREALPSKICAGGIYALEGSPGTHEKRTSAAKAAWCIDLYGTAEAVPFL
jgi:hypothetical protein